MPQPRPHEQIERIGGLLSPVTVRPRAVIPRDDGIVVARDRRRGEEHVSIPGGRVSTGESIPEALAREVKEETGLEVTMGPLLYVVEVKAPVRRHDLNLVFLCTTSGEDPPDLQVLSLEAEEAVLPPILDQVRRDHAHGWTIGEPIWLGNLFDSELRH
jgi:8-oxo-dGTP pyrophosphatase MutT (NUDIX family)